MAKGAATRLRLAVGTLILTSVLAGIFSAAGAAAQGDTTSAAPATPATPAPAASADPQPKPRPGGRKGLFGFAKIQVQPQAYAALVGQPLQGVAGSQVALPELPQNGGVNVHWEVKLGDKSVLEGAGTTVPLTLVEPGTYTLDVTAADGNTEATGTCLLIVDKDSTSPVAVASVTSTASTTEGEPAEVEADADVAAQAAVDVTPASVAPAAAPKAPRKASPKAAAAVDAAAAGPVTSGPSSASRTAGKPKEDLPYIVVSSQHPVLLT